MRYMMKGYLVLTLSMLVTASFGQTGFLPIQNVSAGKQFSFPVVSGTPPAVPEKINAYLQLAELDLFKGREQKNIFEKVTVDNGTIYGGKVSIAYEVLTNTKQNLAIRLTQSSCGATCAYWVRYYNFNPQNGDRYFVPDFFPAVNQDRLRQIITPRRQANIREQIEALVASGENAAHLEEYIYESIEQDDLEDFYFTKDSIFFDNENSLSKNDKFYGLDNETGFSIAEIKHLLNAFGQSALVTGVQLAGFRSGTEPQLYEGKVGDSSAFYLLFRHDYQNKYRGSYAYKKYGRAIYLEGEQTGIEFSFGEKDAKHNETARIRFRKDGFALKGYWVGRNNRKLIFAATRK